MEEVGWLNELYPKINDDEMRSWVVFACDVK